jgi:HEAT repeat protein
MGPIGKELADLGDANSDAIAEALCVLLTDRGDMAVRTAAVDSLADMGRARALPKIAALIDDSDSFVRHAVARSMTSLGKGNDEALGLLHRMLRDEDGLVRGAAAQSVGKIGNGASIRHLEQLADDPNETVRRYAKASIEAIHARGASAKQVRSDAEGSQARRDKVAARPKVHEAERPPHTVGIVLVVLCLLGVAALTAASIWLLRRWRGAR